MRWKWLVTFGVLLIIALLATGYVILANYDYNKLKPRVARIVEEVTGRELNLGGEIDLTIGFSPTLKVSDVTFANASWGSQPQMIKIKQMQVQVAVLPLLFKRVELKHIGFLGVDVFLETDRNGRGNWDFSTEKSSAGIGVTGAFKLHNIDIDKIRIEKLNLTFRDGEREQQKRLTLANLEIAKQGAVDSLALNLKADYRGQELTLAGKTGPPAAVVDYLQQHKPSDSTLYCWQPDDSNNPYFALLGLADYFVVTGDSLSMMVEIARLGKPLAIFPLPEEGGRIAHAIRRTIMAIRRSLRYLPGGYFGYIRDLGLAHQYLLDNGLASTVGQPFVSPRGAIEDQLSQVVARIKQL